MRHDSYGIKGAVISCDRMGIFVLGYFNEVGDINYKLMNQDSALV